MSVHRMIIGASSEIGRETMRVLDRQGDRILAHGFHNTQSLENMGKGMLCQLDTLGADLSREEDCERFIEQAKALCEGPDHLIFAQSPRLELTRFKKITRDQALQHLQVQALSSLEIAKAFLPGMAKRGYGRVVFIISSVTLGMPPNAMADYTMAKYAQLGLMRSLAKEYGSKGVTVNAVSPSMVDTPFIEGLPDNMRLQGAASHPLRRHATVSEVAPAVAFLLSDEARYINGTNLPITGGESV
ncbi:hypothetical protein GZ77_22710 [Endozoicomonas montiporae]|uniref:Short-chain dehydrogenase n=2 Tax=Endozoicomonas montiporae TaxID=1027273 RepID=A0A081N0F0_9GAMM|nr:SDR family oxidoreductase [Endozoicomonas montiporae]AMO54379.1 3-ketoacyl-ACP reductase [Endozoicomonas montiporae CL-33]KEQ11923.1 hypothetical protein GZ77_22710 [Endozoicomonas montiporae]